MGVSATGGGARGGVKLTKTASASDYEHCIVSSRRVTGVRGYAGQTNKHVQITLSDHDSPTAHANQFVVINNKGAIWVYPGGSTKLIPTDDHGAYTTADEVELRIEVSV